MRSQADYLKLFAVLGLAVLAAIAFGSTRAGEPAESVLLVATPELGASYSRTVLIVTRVAQGRHVGVILNRPTRTSLAAMFPDHAPSKRVVEPLHFGGPVGIDAVFALVRTTESPGEGSLQLAPDLFFATAGAAVDRVIEQHPDRARFYAGLVVWQPGELAAEIARGFWFVRPIDADVVFRTPMEGLWKELVRRSQGLTAMLTGE
jgi:putative transcriptional regulator